MTTKTGRANKNDACLQPNCPYSISCHQDTRTLSKLPFPLLTNSYRPLAISKYQHGWNALDRLCWVKRRAKRDHHWKLWSRHQGQQIWKATGLLYSIFFGASMAVWMSPCIHHITLSQSERKPALSMLLPHSSRGCGLQFFNRRPCASMKQGSSDLGASNCCQAKPAWHDGITQWQSPLAVPTAFICFLYMFTRPQLSNICQKLNSAAGATTIQNNCMQLTLTLSWAFIRSQQRRPYMCWYTCMPWEDKIQSFVQIHMCMCPEECKRVSSLTTLISFTLLRIGTLPSQGLL